MAGLAGRHESAGLPPATGLRNPHLQSVLASHRLRRWLQRERWRALEHAAQPVLLDCGHDVRLQGFHNPSRDGRDRGLVVLLHGWEGSAAPPTWSMPRWR